MTSPADPANHQTNRQTAKYARIADEIADRIATEEWPAGHRLPSHKTLADMFGVTIATISHAISEAKKRGLVSARPGSGTYVLAKEQTGGGAITPIVDQVDLRLNTVTMLPEIHRILSEANASLLSAASTDDPLFGYEPLHGSFASRNALTRWLFRRNIEIDSEDILLTHGAQHGIAAALSIMTKPGDTVLCENWVYAGFRRLATDARIELTGVEMDENGLLPDALDRAFSTTSARLLFCSAAAQNPTLATMPSLRRREIVAICRKHDALIIEDDVYPLLVGDEEEPLAALDPERVFYVGGLSKCISAGFRLGFIKTPKRFRPAIQDAMAVFHWTGPAFFSRLFTALEANGAMTQIRQAHQIQMQNRVLLASEYLATNPKLNASYHLWHPVPTRWRLDDFVDSLAERGVRVSPATHFSADASARGQFIRICLGSVEDADLRSALKRTAELLKDPAGPSGAFV